MHSTGVIAAASALLAVAAAVPMHGHQHLHHERDLFWVTKVEEAVVTVAVTETVWVNPGESAPTPAGHPAGGAAAGHGFGAPAASPAEVTPAAAGKPNSPPPAAAPAPSSTSIYVPPPPPAPTTSTYVAPAAPAPQPTTSTSIYVAPAPTTEAPAAPTSTYSPPAAAPAPSSAAPAAPAGGNGLSSGMAAAGTKYTGDLTYYSVGLGSCGITNTDSEHVVAISKDIFDAYGTANPNNNPTCGKTVTITGYDGTAYTATVVDRCVGCKPADLDMGEPFFNIVTNGAGGPGKPADGRAHGFTWEWN